MAGAKWQNFIAKGKAGVIISMNITVKTVMEIVCIAESYSVS